MIESPNFSNSTNVGYLEDSSRAVYCWRSRFENTQTLTVVGLSRANTLHLLNEEMDIMTSAKKEGSSSGCSSSVARVVGVCDNSSLFCAFGDGSAGFIAANPDAFESNKFEFLKSSMCSTGCSVVDADINGVSSLIALLVDGPTQQLTLVDSRRDSLAGHIPLGFTGTPNFTRIVDPNIIAVGSAVCSLFDIRTSQSKQGMPVSVLKAPDSSSRLVVSCDSDGCGSLVTGDSTGVVSFWDLRQTERDAIKSVHAHSGTVLSVALSPSDGLVASSGVDGTIALWSVGSASGGNERPTPTKHRKLNILSSSLGGDTENLKRISTEGNGAAAMCVAIEDDATSHSVRDKKISYVTDTGLAVSSCVSEWFL